MKGKIQPLNEPWFAVVKSSNKTLRFKVKHPSRDLAEAEALRLANENPTWDFFVVECVGVTRLPKVIKVGKDESK